MAVTVYKIVLNAYLFNINIHIATCMWCVADAVSLRHTSDGEGFRGLPERSVVTVLCLTDSGSDGSLSPVCAGRGKNCEFSGRVFAAFSSPGKHWCKYHIKSSCLSSCAHLLLIQHPLTGSSSNDAVKTIHSKKASPSPSALPICNAYMSLNSTHGD